MEESKNYQDKDLVYSIPFFAHLNLKRLLITDLWFNILRLNLKSDLLVEIKKKIQVKFTYSYNMIKKVLIIDN